MKYQTPNFLFPPRPETAIAPTMLTYFETEMKYWAQFKKNGTGTTIAISPDKTFTIWTRHGEPHKAWQLTPHIKDVLADHFPEKEWFYLCVELMHNKTPTIKDTIYIHDMLVWFSEFLLGSTFLTRQDLLDARLKTNVETPTHYVLDPKVWYAKHFEKNFKELFTSIKDTKIDEGMVLKDPNGKLSLCFTETANRSWQVKCRHPNKSYNF